MRRVFILRWIAVFVFCSVCRAEFAVNQRTSQNQWYTDVAMHNDGNFVAVWTSYGQDGSSGGIYARRFTADGNAIGNEFCVNTMTTGNQTESAIAMDSQGDFVVVWHGPADAGDSEEDVYGRIFDVNGAARGDEFKINNRTDGRQMYPAVAMAEDGNFVVVYESVDYPQPDDVSIVGQLFDETGARIGGEFVVNENTMVARFPAVAMRLDESFRVVWIKDTTTNSVWRRDFTAEGTAPYLSIRVNDGLNFTSLTRPDLAFDEVGNCVIVWDSDLETYEEDDVYMRRYHWSGAPIGGDFRVNSFSGGAQFSPSVAMNEDGKFVVVWQGDANAVDPVTDIFGQRFPSQNENFGDPIVSGEEFQVNTYTADAQRSPAVAMSRWGTFVTIWESDGQDGSGYGVFGELGPKVGCADFGGNGIVDFSDYCVLAGEWFLSGESLSADIIDDDKVDGEDLWAFCGQWLDSCED
jgi:hypothetical protein